jgi:hypothetical protein
VGVQGQETPESPLQDAHERAHRFYDLPCNGADWRSFGDCDRERLGVIVVLSR